MIAVKNVIRTTPDCAILGMLNDEFVAGRVGSSTAVTFSSMCAVAGLSVGTCLKTNISQGSVATSLRCGAGICNDGFIANFLLSVSVKNFENGSIFGEDIDKSLVYWFFNSRSMTTRTRSTSHTSKRLHRFKSPRCRNTIPETISQVRGLIVIRRHTYNAA